MNIHINLLNNGPLDRTWVIWDLFLIWSHCCQADTCIQSPGSQRWLQTSTEGDTVHGSEQHATEPHGNRLCVGRGRQFKPGLGKRLPAAPGGVEQRGGKPHRAVQHHQRLHCGHHTRHSITGKHIAPRLWFRLTTGIDWCVVFVRVHTNCVPTESRGNSIRDDRVVTVGPHQLNHCWWLHGYTSFWCTNIHKWRTKL